MRFWAVDTCYAMNLTGAGKTGSDLKLLKIKTSKERDPQMTQKAGRRALLPS